VEQRRERVHGAGQLRPDQGQERSAGDRVHLVQEALDSIQDPLSGAGQVDERDSSDVLARSHSTSRSQDLPRTVQSSSGLFTSPPIFTDVHRSSGIRW
jgi:hypothetical protein